MNIIIKYINVIFEILKENKKLIAICFALYILIVIVSYMLAYSTIVNNMGAFHNYMAPHMNATNFTMNTTAVSLFKNNAFTVIYSYIGGIFFGILPIFSILYNAFGLGSQIATFGFLQPEGSLRYIVYLIPHGIFEIPGSVFGSVSGLVLFRFIWRFFKGLKQSDANVFKEKLYDSYQDNKDMFIQSLILLSVAIILMLIAAPIETYISTPFSRFILHY